VRWHLNLLAEKKPMKTSSGKATCQGAEKGRTKKEAQTPSTIDACTTQRLPKANQRRDLLDGMSTPFANDVPGDR
jgi:hypothetical protein